GTRPLERSETDRVLNGDGGTEQATAQRRGIDSDILRRVGPVVIEEQGRAPHPRCSDANLEPPDVDRKGSWGMQSRRFSGLPLIGILSVIYFISCTLGLMLACF